MRNKGFVYGQVKPGEQFDSGKRLGYTNGKIDPMRHDVPQSSRRIDQLPEWVGGDYPPGEVAARQAMSRYRLMDINLLVNRTLVYSALTAIIIGIYLLVVGYLGMLFELETGNLAISLFATGLIALLVQPLRVRLQRGINRLMYGERDDPYAVLARLGQRLETTLAPEALLPTIVETLVQALKLPYAAITLKQGDEFITATAWGEPVEKPVIVSLVYQAELIGQLLLAPRGPGESFTPADWRLLHGITHHVGAAAHGIRLTADLQRSRERLVTAREEERRRLQRDLHDSLGPALASLALKLDAARNLLKRDPAATDKLLSELKSQAQTTITEVRRLVYDLRPPALDQLGLVEAIRERAGSYQDINGLHITIDAPDRLPHLPAAVEVAAYRIAQEALNNVAAHAQASTCNVRLRFNQVLDLEISDNGRGLPTHFRNGVGLTSMHERAVELGGTCLVEPAPGGGTRVIARLPLTRAASVWLDQPRPHSAIREDIV